MSLEPREEMEQRLRSLLDDRLEGLSRRIEEWLEESRVRAGALNEIVEEARREPLHLEEDMLSSSRSGVDQDTLRTVAAFAQEVEGSTDQGTILGRLISGSTALAPRVLLLIPKGDVFLGWAARGFEPGFSPKSISVPISSSGLLRRAYESCSLARQDAPSDEEDDPFTSLLGGPPSRQMIAAPMWVKDRIVAIVYADSGAGQTSWYPEAVGLVVSLAALSLEAIPTRARFPRPAGGAEPESSPAQPRGVLAGSPASQAEAPARPRDDHPQTPAPQTTPAHDEARRFAKLLVSEILLYNGRQVEEGRRSKDLYQRLKEDIDRSRSVYEQRIAARLAGAPDYFREELVRVLAQGDESAITVPWD